MCGSETQTRSGDFRFGSSQYLNLTKLISGTLRCTLIRVHMIAAYGHRSLLYSVSTQLQERSKSHLSYEVGQAKLVVCFYSIFKTFFFKHENQDGGIVLIPVQVVKIVPPAARVSTVPVPYWDQECLVLQSHPVCHIINS